jgi:hypothetical protein
MRILIQAILPGVLLLLSGCFFSRAESSERSVYDPGRAVKASPLPAVIEAIRNDSGADRRFFYRAKGGRIEFDSGNYWLHEPELAVKGALRRTFAARFAAGSDDAVHISGVIDDFGFDLEKKTSLLTAEFTLTLGKKSRSVKISETAPFDGRSASSAASAMDKCFSQMTERLISEVGTFCKKNGDSK